MKIVSKFHDYYDIGISMGVDKSVVYVRRPEVIDDDRLKNEIRKKIGVHYSSIGVVGFCGKLYPFIVKDHFKNDINQSYDHTEYKYEFDESDAERIAKSVFIFTERIKTRINRIRAVLTQDPVRDDELFHRLGSPSFILFPSLYTREEDRLKERLYADVDGRLQDALITNPPLKEVGFYRVVDAFTAFQELSMYMSGVLSNNQQPPISISDVDMRDAKGFNDRSFKKEPTKRRKK